jgi:hypothetical protein
VVELEGLDDILVKGDQAVIFRCDPVPVDERVNVFGKIDQKGGLAVTGRCTNEQHFTMDVVVQHVQQPHPPEGLRLAAGRQQFYIWRQYHSQFQTGKVMIVSTSGTATGGKSSFAIGRVDIKSTHYIQFRILDT